MYTNKSVYQLIALIRIYITNFILLALRPWNWTFKQQHNIYVQCEYFTNQNT